MLEFLAKLFGWCQQDEIDEWSTKFHMVRHELRRVSAECDSWSQKAIEALEIQADLEADVERLTEQLGIARGQIQRFKKLADECYLQ